MRHTNRMAFFALLIIGLPHTQASASGIPTYQIVDLGNPFNQIDTTFPQIDDSGNLVSRSQRLVSLDTGIYTIGTVYDPTLEPLEHLPISYYVHAAGSDVNLLPSTMSAPPGNAYQVNALGLVLGNVGNVPVVYSAATGQFLDPKSLPGITGPTYMGSINNLGQALGIQNDQFLYYSSPTAVPIPLTDLLPTGSGWKLLSATDINNLGEIVGTGINPSGQHVDYELVPLATPEPSTLAIFGYLALLCTRRKFRLRTLQNTQRHTPFAHTAFITSSDCNACRPS